MSTSLKDYVDFCLLWVKKRTGVHLGNLAVYPALARHCLCCNRGSSYSHRTFGLCELCCNEQTCTLCQESFEPSRDSVARYCQRCWGGIESRWKASFSEDPVRAENEFRGTIMTGVPSLLGCNHTG
ncbi:MAG: hypothetical protein CMJ89_08200 [Planctomycetes bacterium]|jgi:hypothetical protein|nr:hypothetical protein [Planctomycetota bacterium]